MNRMENQNTSCTRSSLIDLDEKIGGYEEKEMTIIAARPAMGKTSLLLSSLVQMLFGYR